MADSEELRNSHLRVVANRYRLPSDEVIELSSMAGNKAQEDPRAELHEAMGPELGDYVHHLHLEYLFLQYKWRQLQHMVDVPVHEREQLGTSVNRFLNLAARSIWKDVLFTLWALADPPTSLGRSNISFRGMQCRLNGAIPNNDEINNCLERFTKSMDELKLLRHRHFAHRDVEAILRKEIQETREHRVHAASAIIHAGELINAVRKSYALAPMYFWGEHARVKDFPKVMKTLLSGKEQQNHRIASIQAGMKAGKT